MNKKYQRYIEYIVSDIEAPYFENMKDAYGLKDSEYEMVLSRMFNQSVTIRGHYVYNTDGNLIYHENSDGYWEKREYDTNDNEIYYEDSDGFWYKKEYDDQGNKIYYEDSYGVIRDNRYE
tara:strand:+ start:55 stop:414 length:360 start_codon:yes stop_codon:yes gene_type:complete